MLQLPMLRQNIQCSVSPVIERAHFGEEELFTSGEVA
jgi:hypothetical protein